VNHGELKGRQTEAWDYRCSALQAHGSWLYSESKQALAPRKAEDMVWFAGAGPGVLGVHMGIVVYLSWALVAACLRAPENL